MPIEEKYHCNICGYESNAAGDCPTDDEPMQKMCLCGSGSYATECCDAKKAAENVGMVEAEAKVDAMEEDIKGAEIVEDEKEENETNSPE